MAQLLGLSLARPMLKSTGEFSEKERRAFKSGLDKKIPRLYPFGRNTIRCRFESGVNSNFKIAQTLVGFKQNPELFWRCSRTPNVTGGIKRDRQRRKGRAGRSHGSSESPSRGDPATRRRPASRNRRPRSLGAAQRADLLDRLIQGSNQ